jgi:hypothetical protein
MARLARAIDHRAWKAELCGQVKPLTLAAIVGIDLGHE